VAKVAVVDGDGNDADVGDIAGAATGGSSNGSKLFPSPMKLWWFKEKENFNEIAARSINNDDLMFIKCR